MKRLLTALTFYLAFSVAAAAQMPVVSGLTTPPHRGAVPSFATGTISPTVSDTKHDCAIFYMGLGDWFFAAALYGLKRSFEASHPGVPTWLNTYYGGGVPAQCKNPLIVGHSLGAIRAVSEGNKAGRGRVVSIDPPDWYTNSRGLRSSRPTVNYYHCPASPYGCGKVTGTNVVNVSVPGYSHVFVPNDPRVHKEIRR